jgi:hypothetical protein
MCFVFFSWANVGGAAGQLQSGLQSVHRRNTSIILAKLVVAGLAAVLHIRNRRPDDVQIAALCRLHELAHLGLVVFLRLPEFGGLHPYRRLGVCRRVIAVRGEIAPGLRRQFFQRQRAGLELTRVVVLAITGNQAHGLQRARKLLEQGPALGDKLSGVTVHCFAAGSQRKYGSHGYQGKRS